MAVLGDSQRAKGLITSLELLMLASYILCRVQDISQPYLYRLVLLRSIVRGHLALPGTG